MITKTDAIHALCPTAGFTINGGKIVQWDSIDPQPTEQEIEVKLAELKYQEEVNVYQEKRKLEYPDWEDQLDKIYHKGINAWKADIKKIKDKYPKTQVGITSIAPIPDWVHTILFEKQKEEYVKAKERLAQYELSAGKKGVVKTETVWDASTNSYVENDVIHYIIDPLPLWVDNERNPLVVQDEKERREAQEVINNIPQAVIDSVDN